VTANEPPSDSGLDPRYTQLPDGSPGRPAVIPPLATEPPFICAIRECCRVAEWRLLGTDERIGFCRHHRDLIEDDGLDLIDDA
jgi:hypothetical protein